jgi:hypothetical protein
LVISELSVVKDTENWLLAYKIGPGGKAAFRALVEEKRTILVSGGKQAVGGFPFVSSLAGRVI